MWECEAGGVFYWKYRGSDKPDFTCNQRTFHYNHVTVLQGLKSVHYCKHQQTRVTIIYFYGCFTSYTRTGGHTIPFLKINAMIFFRKKGSKKSPSFEILYCHVMLLFSGIDLTRLVTVTVFIEVIKKNW